jgi:hypothetical protein
MILRPGKAATTWPCGQHAVTASKGTPVTYGIVSGLDAYLKVTPYRINPGQCVASMHATVGWG